MVPPVTADEARRRSEEAVRRIREESRLRVARRRHRSCFSWCMLASLAGGLSLAAMEAYDARLTRAAEAAPAEQAAAAEQGAAEREAAYDARLRQRVEQAAAQEETRRARAVEACARREAALAKIAGDAREWLEGRTEKERLNILTQVDDRATGVIDAATAAGCDQPVP